MRRRIAAECTREERFQYSSCSCVEKDIPRSAGSSEKPNVFSTSTSRKEFIERSKTVVKNKDKTVITETDRKTVVGHRDRVEGPTGPSSGRPGPRSSGNSSPRPYGSSGDSAPSSSGEEILFLLIPI
jgi:hypothetical protein